MITLFPFSSYEAAAALSLKLGLYVHHCQAGSPPPWSPVYAEIWDVNHDPIEPPTEFGIEYIAQALDWQWCAGVEGYEEGTDVMTPEEKALVTISVKLYSEPRNKPNGGTWGEYVPPPVE